MIRPRAPYSMYEYPYSYLLAGSAIPGSSLMLRRYVFDNAMKSKMAFVSS